MHAAVNRVTSISPLQIQSISVSNSYLKGRKVSILIGIVAIPLLLSVTFVVSVILAQLIFESYAIEKLKDRWSPIGEWDQSLGKRIYSSSDIASISFIPEWRLGDDVGRPAPKTKKIQIRLKNDKVGILIIEREDYSDNYEKYFNTSYSDPDDVKTGKKSFYGECVQQDKFFKQLPIHFSKIDFFYRSLFDNLGDGCLLLDLWVTSFNWVVLGERRDFYRGERGTKVDPRITKEGQVMMKSSARSLNTSV